MLPLRKFSLTYLCLALMPAVSFAQSQTTDIRPNANRLVGEELLNAYKNVTHDGAYNFTDDGEPQRFYTEAHHDDGRATYTVDGQSYDGVWMIRSDALCFTYRTEKFQGGCFRVYRVGNCYYYYDNRYPHDKRELDEDYWTARSVPAGERSNCEPGLS